MVLIMYSEKYSHLSKYLSSDLNKVTELSCEGLRKRMILAEETVNIDSVIGASLTYLRNSKEVS